MNNFIEPTSKYVEANPDIDIETLTQLFNIDLIYYASYFNKLTLLDPELNRAYADYCEMYDLDLSPPELIKKFGDYPLTDWQTLCETTIKKLRSC